MYFMFTFHFVFISCFIYIFIVVAGVLHSVWSELPIKGIQYQRSALTHTVMHTLVKLTQMHYRWHVCTNSKTPRFPYILLPTQEVRVTCLHVYFLLRTKWSSGIFQSLHKSSTWLAWAIETNFNHSTVPGTEQIAARNDLIGELTNWYHKMVLNLVLISQMGTSRVYMICINLNLQCMVW